MAKPRREVRSAGARGVRATRRALARPAHQAGYRRRRGSADIGARPGFGHWPAEVVADGPVPLSRLIPAGVDRRGAATRARLVLFRRPLELRAKDPEDLIDLLHEVLVARWPPIWGSDPDVIEPALPGDETELADPALEPPALALGEAAPDAEPLVVGERVLEALVADLAAHADALGLTGGAALLREERLRVGLRAQRALLPLLFGSVSNSASNPASNPRRRDSSGGVPPPRSRRRARRMLRPPWNRRAGQARPNPVRLSHPGSSRTPRVVRSSLRLPTFDRRLLCRMNCC